jgi:hypothetical protein
VRDIGAGCRSSSSIPPIRSCCRGQRAPGIRSIDQYVEAVRLAEERLGPIERTIAEFLPGWSPIVAALQALRSVDLVVAVTFIVEIGDIRRFETPRQLMGYLGLVPAERSTGETVRRGSITKMGNSRLRQLLVESAWTYRHPPRVGAKKLLKLGRVPPKVREIAWKAQSRLTARVRAFAARGKKLTVTQVGWTSRATAHMKPASSRAIAVQARVGMGPTVRGNSRQTAMWPTRSTPAVR